MRWLLLIIGCLIFTPSKTQTIGGRTVFSFLNFPGSPQLSALGGINISQPGNDVAMGFSNPALLNSNMNGQLSLVFTDMYAGIKSGQIAAGFTHKASTTHFMAGVHYINYGNISFTDVGGNITGNGRPSDTYLQLTASRKYMERWQYGLAAKFIYSNYTSGFTSAGIAFDAGINYTDTSNSFTIAINAKNIGVQLMPYEGTTRGDLPFNLVVGITKRLNNSPFEFSVTAQQLHSPDISYNDTTFNNDNGLNSTPSKKFSFDKLFRHFILATKVYVGDRIQLDAGYNHLRRKELNIGTAGNGLNGFSVGATVLLPALDIRFARCQYQNNTAYHQLSISLPLKKYF